MSLWEIYFIIDVAFILTMLIGFYPKTWKVAKSLMGEEKWKESPYSSWLFKITFGIFVSLIMFITFPLFLLAYATNEQTMFSGTVNHLTKDDDEDDDETIS